VPADRIRAVPTEKRQRQKEGRQVRLAAKRKAQKRRQLIRRTVIIVIVAGVIVGSVLLFTRNSSTATTTTTTTTSTSTTTTIPTHFAAPQAALNAVAAAAGCPRSPSTPANTLHWATAPPKSISQSASYSAVFKTDIGSFTVALDAATAPNTVNNFIFLAKKGFFNCGTFFRVIPGFASQAGSPNQTNVNATQPGYTIPDENMKSSFAGGDLVMANSGSPHTGASQFFFVPKAETISSGTYALFGHVTSGLAVIQRINANGNPTAASNGTPPYLAHRILSVTIIGPS
jgi:peptidyl-prolyl cis-trans isomerase B (cyclophilin B)